MILCFTRIITTLFSNLSVNNINYECHLDNAITMEKHCMTLKHSKYYLVKDLEQWTATVNRSNDLGLIIFLRMVEHSQSKVVSAMRLHLGQAYERNPTGTNYHTHADIVNSSFLHIYK